MKQKQEGQSRATDPGRMETFTGHFNPMTAPPQMEADFPGGCKNFGQRCRFAHASEILPDVLKALEQQLERKHGP